MNELNLYVNALRLGDKSEKTIANYCFNIQKFLDFTGALNASDVDKLAKEDYRNFVRHLQAVGNKNSTINNVLRSVNAFLNWMLDEEGEDGLALMVNDALPEMKFGGRRSKFLKENAPVNKYMTEEVAQAIQDVCERMDERIMIALLRYSGMRVGEIASLRTSDINRYVENDVEEYRIHLTHTKGDKERFVPVPVHMVDAIYEYVKTRKHDSDFLFIGLGTHNAMSTNAIYARVKRLATTALGSEAAKGISPHSFRHTAATNWLRQGKTHAQVGAALGHARNSKQVTDRYAHLDGTMVGHVFASQHIKI